MDKAKKAVLVILVDLVLVITIIFSVYMMLNTEVGSVSHNIFMALIVISIPVIFFTTYLFVIGDKYDFKESEFEDEPIGADKNSEAGEDIDIGETTPKPKDKEEECYENM